MGGRFRRWCLTLNNYDESVDWKERFGRGGFLRCVVGFEKGEAGTRHLQGYLEYKNPVRLTSLKSFLPTAHWEVARGGAYENHEYCSKDGEWFSHGDWKSILEGKGKKGEQRSTSRDVLRRLLDACDQDIRNSGGYLQRKRSYDERVVELRELRVRISRREQLVSAKLQQWQVRVLQELFQQGERKIMWCYEVRGGIGKSFLAKLLHFVYGYDLFDGVTTARDVARFISPEPKGFVLDVTRDNQKLFSYATLEQLKNGFVMSGKYEGIKRLFNVVPVVVFANFYPEKERLSEDRWNIHDLCNAVSSEASEDLPTPIPPPPSFPSFSEEEECQKEAGTHDNVL